MLTVEQSQKQAAQEERDFEASFAATRDALQEEHSGGDLRVEATPELTQEPAPLATEPAPVAAEPTPAEELTQAVAAAVNPDAAVPQNLIAGMTPEQVQSALAQASSQRATIDRLAGHVGKLKQQLEDLMSQGSSAAPALNLKLEKLEAQFPELAAILRDDLANAAVPAQTVPSALTQADIDAAVSQRMNQFFQEQEDRVITERMGQLSRVHPDWQQMIHTPQFTLYRDHVLPAGVGDALMQSQDVGFISHHLSGFKEWVAATSSVGREQQSQPTQPVQQPQQSQARARLERGAAAQRPSSAPATAAGPASEEADFLAAFNKTRENRS